MLSSKKNLSSRLSGRIRSNAIKVLAIVLMLLILNPGSYLTALGHWGDAGSDGPDLDDEAPIEVDDEGGSEEPEIEIDESRPVFAHDLRRTETFDGDQLPERIIGEGDEVVAETDQYILYFNAESLIIKIERKASGYIWSSAPAVDDLSDLSGVWQAFVQAPVVIDYLEPGTPSATWRDFPNLLESHSLDNGLDLQLEFPRMGIELTLELRLHAGDRFTVGIDDESIVYDEEVEEDYIITQLHILPFFGAARDTEADGYLFVPDGPGSLMRFNPARKYANTFSKRVYGIDEGVNRPSMLLTSIPQVDEPQVHMPVFGISHGHQQEAFIAVIEEGADYANIMASPAGVRTNYYWTTAIFNYNEPFFQRTGRGGEGFRYVRREMNVVNPRITYHLLGDEDADYTGMALRYREYLAEMEALPEAHEQAKSDTQLPLYIQAFMAEQEQGLIFNRMKVMTHTDDLLEWMPRFHDLAGDELSLALYGAQRGGVSAHKLGRLGLARKVGGRSGWNDLAELAENLGVTLVAQTDLSVGNNPQMSRGDMVYNIDRSIAHRNTQNFLYAEQYFVDLPAQLEMIEDLATRGGYQEQAALDLASVGYTLLSDFEDGIRTDRHIVRETLTDALVDLSQSQELYLEMPNSYMWAAADAIYSSPAQHTQLLYQTDTVPFMQIVLSGIIPQYSRPMNFGATGSLDLLHMIDFNLYPAFLVTEEESAELRNANTQDIYYSQLDALYPEIESTYNTVNEILGAVRGSQIIGREVPEVNVSVTHYSNGLSVVVNYRGDTVTYGGQEIPGQTAQTVATSNEGG